MQIRFTKALKPLGIVLILGLASCANLERDDSSSRALAAEDRPAEAQVVEASAPTAKPSSKPSKTTRISARPGMRASSMAFPTGDADTSAVLVEKHVPAQVQVGAPFEYETRVTNLTDLKLENVIVAETIDANFVMASSAPKPEAVGGGMSRWIIGNLAPRETKTVRVTGSAKSTKFLKSCVSVSYDSALCASIPVVQPSLQLTAKGPAEVIQCDDIVYRYVVTNPGTGTATDVVVTGNLPEGLLVSGSPRFTKRIGDLAAGKSSSFQVKARASRTGRFAHMAEAAATGGLSAKAQQLQTVVKKPKLEITLTGSKTQFAGRTARYQVTVKNVGDGVAREVKLVETVPSIARFKSATGNGRYANGSIRWTLGDMQPNQSRTFKIELSAGTIGRITTLASASAYCADDVSKSVVTEVKGIPAILLEVVDLDDPIEVGENERYVVTVTNQGTAPATGVKIRVTLPANAEFVSTDGVTPMIGSAPVRGMFDLAPVASIAAKSKVTWTIVVRGKSAADARFRISMTSDQLTSPVEETEATNFYE